MIKYYFTFGIEKESFSIVKIIDLDSDLGLVSFNEETPIVIMLCDYEDDHKFLQEATKNYVASNEISEERYNELKKFLKL